MAAAAYGSDLLDRQPMRRRDLPVQAPAVQVLKQLLQVLQACGGVKSFQTQGTLGRHRGKGRGGGWASPTGAGRFTGLPGAFLVL